MSLRANSRWTLLTVTGRKHYFPIMKTIAKPVNNGDTYSVCTFISGYAIRNAWLSTVFENKNSAACDNRYL